MADGRSTTERGLGNEHQRWRRQNLPRAVGQPCPICGVTMTRPVPGAYRYRPTDAEADHTTPRALGGTNQRRFICARCNRSSGARLGAALRRRVSRPTTSRRWL